MMEDALEAAGSSISAGGRGPSVARRKRRGGPGPPAAAGPTVTPTSSGTPDTPGPERTEPGVTLHRRRGGGPQTHEPSLRAAKAGSHRPAPQTREPQTRAPQTRHRHRQQRRTDRAQHGGSSPPLSPPTLARRPHPTARLSPGGARRRGPRRTATAPTSRPLTRASISPRTPATGRAPPRTRAAPKAGGGAAGGGGGGDRRRREAVGCRLHNYAERSDGESDSPEKEAEFAPHPRADSWDADPAPAGPGGGRSPPEPRRGTPEREEGRESPPPPGDESAAGRVPRPPQEAVASREGQGQREGQVQRECQGQREGQVQREAIVLAIKDIRDAIEEVKTKTVRSPYTPDEPQEPIWVMRKDLSPGECPAPPSDGENSPCTDSPSPPRADSSSRLLLHEDSPEASHSHRESKKGLASFPTYVEVPGPCEPEDLIDGVIFAATYLGSTQLLSEKTPSKSIRMMQAQEAVSRIKTAQKVSPTQPQALEDESHPMTEVDIFISIQRIKVIKNNSQEIMMDHPLQTISYIADIGNTMVLMARRRLTQQDSQENVEASDPSQESKCQYKMICHVFESEDAQLIAQSIGQSFSVAYQEFLRANGINPEDLSEREYNDLLSTRDMYNDDLVHFSKSENCKDVLIEKSKGEILGVVIVESGWGSILPTVIIASMMHAGPAERSGKLNIGDQIMSINGTSLVGLPLSTCQSIIKGLKNQPQINLNIVRCPPVTTVLIRRPDARYQLGFSVQNGIICSLMRGGIAERGGIRVGHRIIEINGQSVVAMPHEKIVHILSGAVGEIDMKTMPAAMYRLLTAQEQPLYI
ncbi:amyloid-beta A4 precursor protein-binding family A member 1-like [Menidia menidia]